MDQLDISVSIFDLDPPTSTNLRSRLDTLGYHVLPITNNFNDALEQLTKNEPKVVFFNTPPIGKDDSLNIVAGLSVLDVPMILVVNKEDKKSLDNQIQPFQFDWVQKPINDGELQATIKLAIFRQKANKKVLDQQQQIKAITHSTGEGFITFDVNGKIAFMNMIAEMMTGWDQNQAFGKNLSEVFTIIDNTSHEYLDLSEGITNITETGPLSKFSITLMSRTGNRIPVRARVSPIRDPSGDIYGGVISFGNISELQQAIRQARLHNQRLDTLLDITAKLNTNLDLDNVLHALLEETTTNTKTEGALVVLVNQDDQTYQVVSTYSIDDALKQYNHKKYHLEAVEKINLDHQNPTVWVYGDIDDEAIYPYHRILNKIPFQTLAAAPLFSNSHLLGVMFIFSMREPRSYSEDELHFLKGLADQASLAITNARLFENVSQSRYRLQFLSKKLVEIQEAEKRSLARELHDQIGQILTGLQFSLESGKRDASGETKLLFIESQEIISDLIKQVRDLSLRLLPSILEDIGLLPTLQWHFQQYTNQTEIHVNFSESGLNNMRFPENIEITGYRIIQEALTNVARYAQVEQVDVEIKVDESIMVIIVSDQGIGFEVEKTNSYSQSFGLISMKERAMLIGGNLWIKSKIGKGTIIEARLPLGNHLERRKHAR
jgi:PAS domain S-box-containing protein